MDTGQLQEMFYAVFYTVFSMSCMALALLPPVLVMRLFFRAVSPGITTALWGIFFVRAIVPVGMSSPVSLLPGWNRRFHTLLRSLGLEISPDRGLMTGWTAVFESDLNASAAYRVCAVLWLAGAVGLMAGMAWHEHRRCRKLRRTAVHLYDRVYASGAIRVPCRTGVIRHTIYVPQGLRAQEIRELLQLQEVRVRRRDDFWRKAAFVICCMHWWNPGLWLAYVLSGRDRARACDRTYWRTSGGRDGQRCAQGLMQQQDREGKRLPFPAFGVERNIAQRAGDLLYCRDAVLWKKAAAAFWVPAVFFYAFGLSALMGGGGGSQAEEPLFEQARETQVTEACIARCDVTVASGSAMYLELVDVRGVRQADGSHRGQCVLRLKDAEGETAAELSLSKVFASARQSFDANTSLMMADYNEDGIPEIAIGQRTASGAAVSASPGTDDSVGAAENAQTPDIDGAQSGEKALSKPEASDGCIYYIVNAEKDALRVVSPAIAVSGVTSLQQGSMVLSYVQGAGGVITAVNGQDTSYYVWSPSRGEYRQREMTEKQLQKRRSRYASEDTQTRYTLQDDAGQEVMAVTVSAQDNGGLAIEKIQINAEGLDHRTGTRSLTDVEGYYYDLQWAQSDGEANRYAVLSYNGTKGRTFSLYDVKKARLCYRPETGNQTLREIFQTYGADADISFATDGEAVYSLMEIADDDTLKVNFAANAQDDVTVAGTYLYQISTGKETSLQYSRD